MCSLNHRTLESARMRMRNMRIKTVGSTDGYDFDSDPDWLKYWAERTKKYQNRPKRGDVEYEEAARRFQTLRRKNEPGTQ